MENHSELRHQLRDDGHVFTSETDAEIVAHLIEKHYDGDLTQAVRRRSPTCEGTTRSSPCTPTTRTSSSPRARSAPLSIGLGEDETFVASAIPAFLAETRKVQFVGNGEVITITPDGASFVDSAGAVVERVPEHVDWDQDAAEKGGYPTFMLKEIHEQADAVAETITDRLPERDRVDLSELELPADLPARIRRIVIVACGTSYHAGLVGRYAIEQWARIPVEMEIASEYRYRNPVVTEDDLVIGITQSGETADTLAAMRLARENGATVLALTNVMGSQATRDADAVLYTRAGLEMGVAATKTFVSQVAAMYLLGMWFAQDRDTLAPDVIEMLIAELKAMPHKIQQTIPAVDERVKAIARAEHKGRFFLYLGRNIGLPVCLEGALKMKEISYIPSDAYAAGEMKHGPIALLDESTPVVVRLHRQPDARQDALQRRGGPRARRRRDLDRHRGDAAGGRGVRSDGRRPPHRLGPAADRRNHPAAAPGVPRRPTQRASTWTSRATSRRPSPSSSFPVPCSSAGSLQTGHHRAGRAGARVCGDDEGGTASGPAAFVPPGAPLYIEAT